MEKILLTRPEIEQLLEKAAAGGMAHAKAGLSNYKRMRIKFQQVADQNYLFCRNRLDSWFGDAKAWVKDPPLTSPENNEIQPEAERQNSELEA